MVLRSVLLYFDEKKNTKQNKTFLLSKCRKNILTQCYSVHYAFSPLICFSLFHAWALPGYVSKFQMINFKVKIWCLSENSRKLNIWIYWSRLLVTLQTLGNRRFYNHSTFFLLRHLLAFAMHKTTGFLQALKQTNIFYTLIPKTP